MLNHDFTGSWTWLFLVLLAVTCLAGPAVLLALTGTGMSAGVVVRRTAIASLSIGIIAIVMQLGWVATSFDLLLGYLGWRATGSSARSVGASRFLLVARKPAALALIVAVSLGSVMLPRARHAGWTGTPDRVNICMHDFRGPGYTYDMTYMDQRNAHPVAVVPVLWRNYELWASSTSKCGSAVYLRTGADQFRRYAVLGEA